MRARSSIRPWLPLSRSLRGTSQSAKAIGRSPEATARYNFQTNVKSRSPQWRSVICNEHPGTAEAIIHANLDLAQRAAVPHVGHAIGRKRRAGPERDVVVFRLGRPVPSKVELGAVAKQPAASCTAGAEAVGQRDQSIHARTCLLY